MDLASLLGQYGVSPQQLARLQSETSKLKARILVEGWGIRVELAGPAEERVASAVVSSIAQSLANSLYMLYGIRSEVFR
jgi:hypothetical protein